MNEPSTFSIWIAGLSFAFLVVTALVRFVHRLSRLEARVDTLETDAKKTDASVANLVATAALMRDAMADARVHAANNFVSLEHMTKIEDKIDSVAERTGKIEVSQAEHGALMKGIGRSLDDLRNAIQNIASR